ncbi:hypothetical protein ID866_3671 [Astraeus odoratus]|nr:hypothetical protein ID866_3671 [Astraeus odoratus]
MFGESDSESPRVPSPWDSITSAPPTPPTGTDAIIHAIPRLHPEVEEGNVEYKLQLLSPSPARFARLVTQLKWRLLEGGGQAYYEIGVADSGALVGLPRQELEESLETLETMAGEIGASVIVVKEIEVPPALSAVAQSQLERWEGRRRKRKDLLREMHDIDSSATSTTEPETEMSTAEVTDPEDVLGLPSSSPIVIHGVIQHSVAIPTDSPVAVFNMEPETVPANGPDDDVNGLSKESVTFAVDLEIASVYKPRPMRQRSRHVTSAAVTHFDKRTKHVGGKKGLQRKQGLPQSDHTLLPTQVGIQAEGASEDRLTESQPMQARVHGRKHARERRRGLKPGALLTDVSASQCHVGIQVADSALATRVADDTNSLVSSFDCLHVTVDPLSCPSTELPGNGPLVDTLAGRAETGRDSIHGQAGTVTMKGDEFSANERRRIVEALVIRKMSLEDSFLDFGGFSFG